MALLTLGTNSTTTLNALVYNPQVNAADLAQIVENIKSQPSAGTYQVIAPGSFDQTGRLHFPGRRGFVNLKPGDYIAYDAVGWPVIVSGFSIANSGGWTHS